MYSQKVIIGAFGSKRINDRTNRRFSEVLKTIGVENGNADKIPKVVRETPFQAEVNAKLTIDAQQVHVKTVEFIDRTPNRG